MWIWPTIDKVNQAAAPLKLKLVFTVTDAAHPGKTVVLALHSNNTKTIVEPTDTQIEKICHKLCELFDGVDGPFWYWDEGRHGPG